MRIRRKVKAGDPNRQGLILDYNKCLQDMLERWEGRIPVVFDEYKPEECDKQGINLSYAFLYNPYTIIGFCTGFDDLYFEVSLTNTGRAIFQKVRDMFNGQDGIYKIAISTLYDHDNNNNVLFVKLRLEIYEPDPMEKQIVNEEVGSTESLTETSEIDPPKDDKKERE